MADNRNAEWIPEAGGYVSNGVVISKTPQYGEDGKMLTNASNGVATQTAPQVATNQETNLGANDVNSNLQSQVGSMGTSVQNTNTQGSVISSNAVVPNQQVSIPQTPVTNYTNNQSQAISNGDYTNQTENVMSNMKNEVNKLADQRANALTDNNQALANQYEAQMGNYQVVQTPQVQAYDMYVSQYTEGLNEIVNSLSAMFSDFKDYVYNPAQDINYQIASKQVEGQINANMTASGMYYTSMRTHAVAAALSSLMVQYREMDRQERIENMNMLMNFGNYLMNIDNFQRDIWYQNIQVEQQNLENRYTEIDRAWKRVELLGYVDNETASILGLTPGDLSPSVRQAMLEEKMQIRAEQRQFETQRALYQYQRDVDLEYQRQLADIEVDTYSRKLQASGNTTTPTVPRTSVPYTSNGEMDYEAIFNGKYVGSTSKTDLVNNAEADLANGMDKLTTLIGMRNSAKNESDFDSAVAQLKDEEGNYVFDTKYIADHGIVEYAKYLAGEDTVSASKYYNTLEEIRNTPAQQELDDAIDKYRQSFTTTESKTKAAVDGAIETIATATKNVDRLDVIAMDWGELIGSIWETKNAFDYPSASEEVTKKFGSDKAKNNTKVGNQGIMAKQDATMDIINYIDTNRLYGDQTAYITSYLSDLLYKETQENSHVRRGEGFSFANLIPVYGQARAIVEGVKETQDAFDTDIGYDYLNDRNNYTLIAKG